MWSEFKTPGLSRVQQGSLLQLFAGHLLRLCMKSHTNTYTHTPPKQNKIPQGGGGHQGFESSQQYTF